MVSFAEIGSFFIGFAMIGCLPLDSKCLRVGVARYIGTQGTRNPMIERNRPALVSVDETPLQRSFAELGALTLRQVRRTPEEADRKSVV